MWCFWSAKGGAGCSTVALATAMVAAQHKPTLLVDLDGDLAALVGGLKTHTGIVDWMLASEPPPDALSRLELSIGSSLSLLPWGHEPAGWSNDSPDGWQRSEILARLLASDDRLVIVDLGLLSWHRFAPPRVRLQQAMLGLSTRTILVTRSCPLSMAAAQRMAAPDDVVLVGRRARSSRPKPKSAAAPSMTPTGPVTATVRWDPSVANVATRGQLGRRVPRSLRSLSRLMP